MTNNRYANALSLAAQATICLSRNIPVIAVQLNDNISATEATGHCIHFLPKHWRDNVWVTLSAPVALAIHEGRGKNSLFRSCDATRYEKALNLCHQHVSPKLPAQLKNHLMFDTKSKVKAVQQGIYPEGVKGPIKGALTRFGKEYLKTEELAERMLSREIDDIFNHAKSVSSFMTCTYLIGEHILSKGKLSHDETIKIYRDGVHTVELTLDNDLYFEVDY